MAIHIAILKGGIYLATFMYISSNYKRDLSRIEEGRDEAQQFLDDLVFEISGVEK